MFIGACGFGSTGSSVITDYLKEFDDVNAIGLELCELACVEVVHVRRERFLGGVLEDVAPRDEHLANVVGGKQH